MMNRSAYISTLSTLSGKKPLPDTTLWPLTHTSNTREFSLLMGDNEPELKSRDLRGKQSPDGYFGSNMVFAYAAPCLKKIGEGVVMVFAAASMDDTDADETAHPFDSGGLRKYSNLNRYTIRDLVRELTFDSKWRESLSLYVAALFEEELHYLNGIPPSKIDPLKLGSKSGKHDRHNFTWEVMTENKIRFENRLVAVVSMSDDDGRYKISTSAEMEVV